MRKYDKEKTKVWWKNYYKKNRKKELERGKLNQQKKKQDPKYKEQRCEISRNWYYKNKGIVTERRLRLRFQVLARDSFTCQYCGRKAPDVILQIDHIFPKSKGGLNNIKNFKTACADCNMGKSDFLL
jgi:hypothetical protein